MKHFFLIVLLLTSITIYSQEEIKSKIFSQKEIDIVLSGEIVSRMYLKHNAVNENTDKLIVVPKTKFTSEDFTKYEMISDEKAFIPYKIDGESKLKFYNTLIGFSKLKDAQYWTFNGNKKVTFILDCFSLDNQKNKNRIADKVAKAIDDYTINFYQQEDNKFGKLIFKSELYNIGNSFITVNSTTEQIFPVTGAGEYKIISFFLYDEEKEGFFYYTVSAMRIKIDLLLRSGKLYPTTFSNRLRGGTVHLAKLLGLNWEDKIITWDYEKLKKGEYKNY